MGFRIVKILYVKLNNGERFTEITFSNNFDFDSMIVHKKV